MKHSSPGSWLRSRSGGGAGGSRQRGQHIMAVDEGEAVGAWTGQGGEGREAVSCESSMRSPQALSLGWMWNAREEKAQDDSRFGYLEGSWAGQSRRMMGSELGQGRCGKGRGNVKSVLGTLTLRRYVVT